jgi:septum formation protein
VTSRHSVQPATICPFIPWPDGDVLILASRSPRRADLLAVAGVPFEVIPAADAEAEHSDAAVALSADPVAYAELLAGVKAEAIAAEHPERLVLGADTIVVLNGCILEKPKDEAEAISMLGRMAGRSHTVVSAVALRRVSDGLSWTAAESTAVTFMPLDQDTITRYVATGEPMDKAGAYGIQGYGAMMVRGVDGCYFNVMGLPLALLGSGLRTVLGG